MAKKKAKQHDHDHTFMRDGGKESREQSKAPIVRVQLLVFDWQQPKDIYSLKNMHQIRLVPFGWPQ